MTAVNRVAIANAPVSFGAFELTVGIMSGVPDSESVLEAVAGAGYAGIDLGPIGYLGFGDELRSSLVRHGLALAGGFFQLPFSDVSRMPAEIRELDALLDVFDIACGDDGELKPKPTLADAGSAARRARPGQAVDDRSLGLDDEEWRRFAQGVETAAAHCRERGYEPTFHHETGTYVEAPWEIEKVLELTSIGLCLDTGHLLLGGGDPVEAMREWRGRINHLHLKDARRSVVAQIVRDAAPASEIWRRRAFCRLGEGDLDVDGVLSLLRGAFAGWVVVEQDTLPEPDGSAAADQRANREFLARKGF